MDFGSQWPKSFVVKSPEWYAVTAGSLRGPIFLVASQMMLPRVPGSIVFSVSPCAPARSEE